MPPPCTASVREEVLTLMGRLQFGKDCLAAALRPVRQAEERVEFERQRASRHLRDRVAVLRSELECLEAESEERIAAAEQFLLAPAKRAAAPLNDLAELVASLQSSLENSLCEGSSNTVTARAEAERTLAMIMRACEVSLPRDEDLIACSDAGAAMFATAASRLDDVQVNRANGRDTLRRLKDRTRSDEQMMEALATAAQADRAAACAEAAIRRTEVRQQATNRGFKDERDELLRQMIRNYSELELELEEERRRSRDVRYNVAHSQFNRN